MGFQVNLAVAAARAAFSTGLWSGWTGAQRAKCMLKFADLLESKTEELAEWDTKSMGVPLGTAREAFYPSCVESFRCECALVYRFGAACFGVNHCIDLVDCLDGSPFQCGWLF